jgi:hypothetical protein
MQAVSASQPGEFPADSFIYSDSYPDGYDAERAPSGFSSYGKTGCPCEQASDLSFNSGNAEPDLANPKSLLHPL